jgi:chromosome segregation ATPase
MNNFLKILILIIAIAVLSFDALLYRAFEGQKAQVDTVVKQQQLDSQTADNQFKYEQEELSRLHQSLQDLQIQISDQKTALADQQSALLAEIEKRRQMENDNKSVQTSLIDIKAEADAIKEDMKTWQKDYVGVLAQLEKKMDASQQEIQDFESNLTALNIPELKENIDSLKQAVNQAIDKMAASRPPQSPPTVDPTSAPEYQAQDSQTKP